MPKKLILLVALIGCISLLSGCETMEDVGKDVGDFIFDSRPGLGW